MTKNVVKLEHNDDAQVLLDYLSEDELTEFNSFRSHPSTIGNVVFGADSEVIYSRNIDEAHVAVFANVFDICGALAGEIGQKTHAGAILESRTMEITCRRFDQAFAVIMQAKGKMNAGAR